VGWFFFGPEKYSLTASNYVPFVIWFNFVAGFFYIFAGVCLFLQSKRGTRLSMLITLITLIVFATFGIYILNGGAFKMRTVLAMSLRSLFWIGITVFAFKKLK